MEYHFRKAFEKEHFQIWKIFEYAILRMKEEGSDLWQEGYPNPEVIQNDIDKDYAYVLTDNDAVIGYCAVLINESEYDSKVKWFTSGDFAEGHRIVISKDYLGKGFSIQIINHIVEFCIELNIKGIRADTSPNNHSMLKIFEKLDFKHCGKVHFRKNIRWAFEKVL